MSHPAFPSLARRLRPLLLLSGLLAAAVAPAQQLAVWGDTASGQGSLPAGLSQVIQISAGLGHCVALSANGTVRAWGYNNANQCNVPADLPPTAQVAAGGGFCVALLRDGTVREWGGVGSIPSGLGTVVQVSGGFAHALAVNSAGSVKAWGLNPYGQLNVPSGLTNAVQSSAGFYHSMALKSDGTVVAWGFNGDGECNIPSDLSGVVQIVSGAYHNLALKSNGTVVAWGADNVGQSDVPAGLTGVVKVAAGGNHSMALKSDGTVVSWGANDHGETTVPAGLNDVADIAAGDGTSYALHSTDVSLDQSTVYTGNSATGTVALVNAPGAGGATVGLSSDDASVHVPNNVTVPEGAHSATFPITTDLDFKGDRTAHLYALRAGKTYTASFTLKSNGAALAITQNSVVGGSTSTPALTLNLAWAPAADATFSVSSSDPAVTVPTTVTVPAGQTSVRFFPHHAVVPATKFVQLTALYGGSTLAGTTLALKPLTATILFVPSSIFSGQSSTALLQLNAPISSAMEFSLASGGSVLTVPGTVRVAKGDKGAFFAAQAGTAGRALYVPVTAQVNGKAFTAKLQILPLPSLSVLSVPTYGYGNQVVAGTVILTAPAPAGGISVALSDDGGITVPATVTVPEGETTASFPITLPDVSTETAGSVTGKTGLVTISKPISTRPLTISSLALSASTVVGGNPATGTVTLNAVVNIDTLVQLSSDNAVASVPATVTIPAGSQSATFTITTTHPASAKNVKITVAKNGTSAYRTLKVTP